MVHRCITDIEIPNYCWQKLKPQQHIGSNIAFDTETVKGAAFLICDSNGRKSDISDFKPLLSYLHYKPYRNSINWFYNLEYDTNAILKYLPYKERKEIAEDNTTSYEGYQIDIIPKKELKISQLNKDDKPKNATVFYDLAQFYEMVRLKKLAEQTQYAKVDVEDIQNIDLQKYYNNTEYNQLINNRCLIDCKITKELADSFVTKISPIVLINKFKSKASIARRYVLENIAHSLKVPSKQLIQASLNAYHAGHIEACKLGTFTNIKNYDINSAYPAVTAELYDSTGIFKHNQQYESDTAYSFYLINVDYYDENLTPIWINVSSKNYHPNGRLDIWVTQPELEFFEAKGFDYQIKEAYHLMKRANHEKPFKNLVHDLYNKRLEAKASGDPIQLTYKIILNSIYGVCINTVNKKEISEYETDIFRLNEDGEMIFYKDTYKATNMYNPLFAAYITAHTRIKLFTDFYKHLDKLISVNTDGVYLTSGNGVTVSKKLGDYSLKIIDKIMVMGSGRYFCFDGDKVDNKESRFRSIPKSPTEILQMMKNYGDGKTLEVTRDKPIKLKESVKIGKYRDKFNEFRSVTKNVSFKIDRRHWYDQFDTIGDIFDKNIDSRPFDVSEL